MKYQTKKNGIKLQEEVMKHFPKGDFATGESSTLDFQQTHSQSYMAKNGDSLVINTRNQSPAVYVDVYIDPAKLTHPILIPDTCLLCDNSLKERIEYFMIPLQNEAVKQKLLSELNSNSCFIKYGLLMSPDCQHPNDYFAQISFKNIQTIKDDKTCNKNYYLLQFKVTADITPP